MQRPQRFASIVVSGRGARVLALAVLTSLGSIAHAETQSSAPPAEATTPPAQATTPPAQAAEGAAKPELKPFREEIKGTTLAVEMVPVVPADGSKPFYIAKFETSWDLYDVFLFGFDKDKPGGSTPESDAVTRPSKPYISMDRGFGHAGYPVISTSYLGAKKFCEWLSVKTGKPFRLPTVKEFQTACALGAIPKDAIGDHAWSAENSSAKTQPLGSKKPDALGVHDLLGNASEWCTAEDGKGVTMGGTFKDPAADLRCDRIVPYSPDWNASDPQFPKSRWWLADGGFVGFRVVCDLH
jgi:formylglycine-generating enzyme required for sulfatase activity